jgi:hypothetical protein
MKELKVGRPLHLITFCTCDMSHGSEASGIFPLLFSIWASMRCSALAIKLVLRL